MSRDMSPIEHVLAEFMYEDKGIKSPYLENVFLNYDGNVVLMFSKKELEFRRKHKAMAVMCSDFIDVLQQELTPKELGKFSSMLTRLMNRVKNKQSIDDFPEPVLTWFLNKHNHYYNEPNREEFLEYVLKTYKGKE